MPVKNPHLHRYWLRFAPAPFRLQAGCGVTAFSLDDALGLVQDKLLNGKPLPKLIEHVEDIDISTLDAGHVLPNMEEPVTRGIWFPAGCRP